MADAKQIGPYEVLQLKHPDPDAKTAVLSCRLSADLNRRMHEACDGEPYRISVSALVHRGITLAIEELAAIRKTMVERHEQKIALAITELETLRASMAPAKEPRRG